MAKFEACDCNLKGCFRCAVGFVISSLGFSVGCECFSSRRAPCRNRCQQMFPDWSSALDRCVAPYSEWSRRRAGTIGFLVTEWRVERGNKLLAEGGQDTAQQLSALIESHGVSFYVRLDQDLERAAEEVVGHAYSDPISYDAAGIIVARHVTKTGVVPAALRGWAVDVLTGAVQRPKVKGKLVGATRARDKMIYRLIAELISVLDLTATTSDRELGDSACHAVAEGFRLLGLQPTSYQSFVKIWENRSTLREFHSNED